MEAQTAGMLGCASMARSRLRLAIFTAQAPWGEGESFVLTEITELRRRVEAMIVIPVWPGSALVHDELAREVGQFAIWLPLLNPRIFVGAIAACFRCPREIGRLLMEVILGSRSWGVLLKNLAIFPKALHVAKLIRQFRAHHIHAHWASVPATMALVVSRVTGVPWSFTAHRWDIAENNLLAIKIRAALFSRVISLNGQNKILKILGESTCSTLHVIHMGTVVPDQNYTCFAKNKREFHIACIGNLLEVKGHRYLIKACQLLRQRGFRFVCRLIGGGPLRSDLEAMVQQLGLQEFVRFHGGLPHAEVMRMLQEQEFDLVVHPSIVTPSGEHEGIPLALMETLAHRVPAISTASGGISELLGDGAGVLVKPADPEALADAIQRVMEDLDYRATLIETGFTKVLADFNIRTVAEQLVALMEAPGRSG